MSQYFSSKSERSKARSYLGVDKTKGLSDGPKDKKNVIFCPVCKGLISLTDKNNLVRVYFVQGRTKNTMVYKEGRICPDCGVITTKTGRVKYEDHHGSE